MKTKRGFIQKLHDAADANSKKKAVSPVIATLLLIAIAVAAGIILYVFVSGLTTSLSNVKGTVTEPLQLTVLSVSKLSGSSISGTSWQMVFQVINPNGATVTLTSAVITDNTGAQVAVGSLEFTTTTAGTPATATCSALSPATTTVSATTNQAFTMCFSSTSGSGLDSGDTYRLTVIGNDGLGNQYSSNPSPFTLK